MAQMTPREKYVSNDISELGSLYFMDVSDLKTECKRFRLTGYSGLKKVDLVIKIKDYVATIDNDTFAAMRACPVVHRKRPHQVMYNKCKKYKEDNELNTEIKVLHAKGATKAYYENLYEEMKAQRKENKPKKSKHKKKNKKMKKKMEEMERTHKREMERMKRLLEQKVEVAEPESNAEEEKVEVIKANDGARILPIRKYDKIISVAKCLESSQEERAHQIEYRAKMKAETKAKREAKELKESEHHRKLCKENNEKTFRSKPKPVLRYDD